MAKGYKQWEQFAMMIDVTVADVDLDLIALYTHMNPLTAGAAMIWQSKTRVVFETVSGDRFVVTGSDLQWRAGGLEGGAVTALTFRSQGVDLIRFANLQTTGDLLWAAMRAEQTGADPAALTHLLVRHCWTYHGSTGVDYFPQSTVAPFGMLDPTGNDMIYLNAGDDVFFTGAARDTVMGGAGDDRIAGGSENDLLYGGSGADRLLGGSQDDWLEGGRGADVLMGGSGNDLLVGGAGADLFVFYPGAGTDVIRDYTPGLDHLQIAAGVAVVIADRGADTLIEFGVGSVLLQGVMAGQLSAADFL